jgi:cell division protein FtsI/penicillin-binding protein 2
VEGWPKPIKNSDFETHGPHGRVTMVEVLSESLNTGTIHIMEKIGAPVFAEYVKQFGFGQKTGIELETEGSSNIASLDRQPIRPVEAATASFGQGITATPLQLVTAYSAIANGGFLMKPYLVGKIVSGEDQIQVTEPRQIRRVISERTSMLLSGMMVNVVDDGHAKLASVDGYYVAGKTGTAQVASREKRGYGEATIHSFAGFAPVEEPKFVMLIRLNNPKGIEYSASTAAPLFGELAEFILNYYEVPKER